MTWPCAAIADADLSARTTVYAGGRVQWLLEPADPGELVAAWAAAREQGIVPRVLGGGANLIVEDGLHPGVVIATERMRRVFRPNAPERGAELFELGPEGAGGSAPRENHRLVAWCGAPLPGLVRDAASLGLGGIEGLVGIPGTVGGAVAMNAGGKWGETWDVVELVRVLNPDGSVEDLPRAAHAPSYRNGRLGERVVLAAVLALAPGDPAAIEARRRAHMKEKQAAQPLTERSAGCIFKNPDRERSGGLSAGQLLDRAGAKGLRRGDAMVSERHANFIVNVGRASATDVLGLIEDARERVAQRFGLRLECEVVVWRRPEQDADVPAVRP